VADKEEVRRRARVGYGAHTFDGATIVGDALDCARAGECGFENNSGDNGCALAD
jgi:hypothetical protein